MLKRFDVGRWIQKILSVRIQFQPLAGLVVPGAKMAYVLERDFNVNPVPGMHGDIKLKIDRQTMQKVANACNPESYPSSPIEPSEPPSAYDSNAEKTLNAYYVDLCNRLEALEGDDQVKSGEFMSYRC